MQWLGFGVDWWWGWWWWGASSNHQQHENPLQCKVLNKYCVWLWKGIVQWSGFGVDWLNTGLRRWRTSSWSSLPLGLSALRTSKMCIHVWWAPLQSCENCHVSGQTWGVSRKAPIKEVMIFVCSHGLLGFRGNLSEKCPFFVTMWIALNICPLTTFRFLTFSPNLFLFGVGTFVIRCD